MHILFFAAKFHRNQHAVLDALLEKKVAVNFYYWLSDPTQMDHSSAEKLPISMMYKWSEILLFPLYYFILFLRGKPLKRGKIRNGFSFLSLRCLYRIFSAHGEKIVIVRDNPFHGRRLYTLVIKKFAKFYKVRTVVYNQERLPFFSNKEDAIVISPASKISVFSSNYSPRHNRMWHVPLPVKKPSEKKSCARNAPFLMLSTGRYTTPNKRLDMLVTAFSRLPRNIKANWELCICGHGSCNSSALSALQSQVNALGISENVRLLVNLSKKEMERFYQSADLFVLSSCRDSYSLSVLEALACGVPVMASDGNGSSDLLKDGWNGFLFSAGVQASLDDKLKRATAALKTSKNQLGENAIATYENHLTYEAYCARLEQVLINEFDIKIFG